MLLQEEQRIIHWLTEYGALTKTQVIRMLKDKPPQTAEKIIRGLKRDVLLYDISGGYYLGVDPMCQPDPRMILAVWVLLQFIDKVEPMAHYPATYPSQIFFSRKTSAMRSWSYMMESSIWLACFSRRRICGTSLSCPISAWRRNWCCRMSPACLPL